MNHERVISAARAWAGIYYQNDAPVLMHRCISDHRPNGKAAISALQTLHETCHKPPLRERKVEAIKHVRAVTGSGLKEAKDFVELEPFRFNRLIEFFTNEYGDLASGSAELSKTASREIVVGNALLRIQQHVNGKFSILESVRVREELDALELAVAISDLTKKHTANKGNNR